MNNITNISMTKCGGYAYIHNEKGEIIAQGWIEPKLPEGAKMEYLETFHGITENDINKENEHNNTLSNQ